MYVSYDVLNRVSAMPCSPVDCVYTYDAENRRVSYVDMNGNQTLYFYGADGQKLATYWVGVTATGSSPGVELVQQSYNAYFTGFLVVAESVSVATDRLGSVPWSGGYYPYGVEYTATANDREKYATYTRDSLTGYDYAVNRYYASQWGRFLSADPTYLNVDLENSQSWNMYAYVNNDPANSNDPTGQYLWVCSVSPMIPQCPGIGGGGSGGGGGGSGPCSQVSHHFGWDPMDPCNGGSGPRSPSSPRFQSSYPKCNPGDSATEDANLSFIVSESGGLKRVTDSGRDQQAAWNAVVRYGASLGVAVQFVLLR